MGFLDTLSSIFQFHKGTIKPIEQTSHRQINGGFQFHKGTIKPFCLIFKCIVMSISIP